MNFTPKTEKELAAESLLPDGIYPFEVTDAVDAISKTSGAEMIAIKIRVFGPAGREPVLNDYLLASYMRKIFNFSKFTGNEAKYHAGSLCAQDCLGKNGYVKIGTDAGKEMKDRTTGAPTGRFFDPKNAVKDYVPAPANAAPAAVNPEPVSNGAATAAASQDIEEDIPF